MTPAQARGRLFTRMLWPWGTWLYVDIYRSFGKTARQEFLAKPTDHFERGPRGLAWNVV